MYLRHVVPGHATDKGLISWGMAHGDGRRRRCSRGAERSMQRCLDRGPHLETEHVVENGWRDYPYGFIRFDWISGARSPEARRHPLMKSDSETTLIVGEPWEAATLVRSI